MNRTRLRDVAERAGVSAQTVSRVLRAPHLVSVDTNARIRAILDELGYFPNEQATALRLGHTKTIGLLFHLLDSMPMPFLLDVIAGAEERAFALGYSLVMCDASGPLDKEAQYLSLLLSQRVAGIIYTAPRCTPDRYPVMAKLLKTDVPVVVISANLDDLPYRHVRTDDVRAGYVAMRHLLDCGRRHVAVVASERVTRSDSFDAGPAIDDRLAGAAQALADCGITAETPVYFVANTAEGGYAAGKQLLSGDVRPDGVMVTTDIVALGCLEALRAADLRIPEDIALLGHDGLFFSQISVPSLTTIAPPRRQMGRACVDSLLDGPAQQQSATSLILDAELIVRESTIGMGLRPRQGLSTAISVDNAWSAWRGQIAQAPGPQAPASVPIIRATLDEYARLPSGQ